MLLCSLSCQFRWDHLSLFVSVCFVLIVCVFAFACVCFFSAGVFRHVFIIRLVSVIMFRAFRISAITICLIYLRGAIIVVCSVCVARRGCLAQFLCIVIVLLCAIVCLLFWLSYSDYDVVCVVYCLVVRFSLISRCVFYVEYAVSCVASSCVLLGIVLL